MRDVPFDVFLSHSSDDDAAALRIATRLREAGFAPWIDNWYCSGGGRFLHEIDQGITDSRAFAVLIGPGGITPWMSDEIDVAYSRSVNDRSFRVFLVLLPGLPDPFDRTSLLSFLRTKGWVDFRKGFETEHQFQAIIHAIQGRAPEPPDIDRSSSQEPPYRGLEAFDEAHAEFYFGRDADVQHLLEMLKGSRFLAVIGPSGTGKSSLVRAGLIPALRGGQLSDSEHWRIAVTRPGAHPLASLAAELVRLDPVAPLGPTLDRLSDDARTLDHAASLLFDQSNPRGRLLLVVDQFEELFTLCHDEDERQRYLDNLLYAATAPDGRCLVVITLRADFYPRCAAYPELAALVGGQQVLIGPLDREGLRAVIVEPAYKAGLQFEDGLVDVILEDVERQPGALPLLEHALLELWNNRRGTLLTLEGYQASGGVSGAIAKTAERQFAALTPDEQVVARRMFLRLTEPGEGTEDTRRRARLDELALSPGDAVRVETVVDRLVEARLITTSVANDAHGQPQVDVAHEALIRGWPRLKSWIDEDRAGLRVQRRITNDALEWQRRAYDEDSLYRGARLLEANEFARRPDSQLNELELAFIAWGNAIQDRERAEIELRRLQKERDRRRLVAVLSAAALLLLIGFGIAVYQRENAIDDRNSRATAEAEAVVQQAIAEANAREADAAKVQAQDAEGTAQAEAERAQTAEADALAQKATADAERQNAVAQQEIAEANATLAANEQANALAQQATAEANAQESKARELVGVASSGEVRIDQALLSGVEAGHIDPASVSDYLLPQLLLNDVRFIKLLTPPNPESDLNYDLCTIPAEDRILIAGLDSNEMVTVWDLDTSAIIKRFGSGNADPQHQGLIACDPTGALIATTTNRESEITIWDLESGEALSHIESGTFGTPSYIYFSPVPNELVVQSTGGTFVWNIELKREVFPTWVPTGVGLLAGKLIRVSADGSVVAVFDRMTGTVSLESRDGGWHSEIDAFDRASEDYKAIVLSPDGTLMAFAVQNRDDNSSRVVIIRTGPNPTKTETPIVWDPVETLPGFVIDLAFSSDNYWLATATNAGQTMLFIDARADGVFVQTNAPILPVVAGYSSYRVLFLPGEDDILASLGVDGSIALWDPLNMGQSATSVSATAPGMAVDSTGTRLALMSCESRLSLWELNPRQRIFIDEFGSAACSSLVDLLPVTITGDGSLAAGVREDGTVVLLDATARKLRQGANVAPGSIVALRFNETASQLLALDRSGLLHRWLITEDGLTNAPSFPLGNWLVTTAAWTQDGRYLVIVGALAESSQDVVYFWDLRDPERFWELDSSDMALMHGPTSIAIDSEATQIVAVLVDGTQVVWSRASNWTWTQEFVGIIPFGWNPVMGVAILGDGQVYQLTFGNRIGVFSLEGKRLLSWQAPQLGDGIDLGLSIAASADGKVLVTVSPYGALVWNLDSRDWEERACDAAGRNFTMEEWQQFFGEEPYRRTCEQFPLGWGVPFVTRETLLPWG